MKKVLICAVVLGFIGAGCQQTGDKKSVKQIQDQVMVIHDQVMPRQDEMMDLKEKISHQIDSLSKITPATPALKTRQEEGIAITKSLIEAETLMDDWMHQYSSDTLKGMEDTQAKAYLDGELAKITNVKEKINGGIIQAKKFLGN